MTETSSPAAGGADFETELAKLAKSIVQKAALETTPFDESVDAFKSLTTYYALWLKHRQGDEDDDGGFSFASGLTAAEPPNGSANVRSRPRRATTS